MYVFLLEKSCTNPVAGCYYEAKVEDLKCNGYIDNSNLEILNAEVRKQVSEKWIETDYKFRVQLERMKSLQDEHKFYKSLSLQAEAKGNLELCKRWEAVIVKEKEGSFCNYELLLAWSLQRRKTTPQIRFGNEHRVSIGSSLLVCMFREHPLFNS
jgi:hypothetical protein